MSRKLRDSIDIEKFAGFPTIKCGNCNSYHTHIDKFIAHGTRGFLTDSEGEEIDYSEYGSYRDAANTDGVSKDSEDKSIEISGCGGRPIEKTSMEVVRGNLNNPSNSGAGISIILYCEQCPKKTRFHVYHHKGNTRIGTEVLSEK